MRWLWFAVRELVLGVVCEAARDAGGVFWAGCVAACGEVQLRARLSAWWWVIHNEDKLDVPIDVLYRGSVR